MLVGAGKEGKIYLIDRDNMGHYNAGGTTDNVVQTLSSSIGGTWGTPTFFNNLLTYITPNAKALAFTVANNMRRSGRRRRRSRATPSPIPVPRRASRPTAAAPVPLWAVDKGTNTLLRLQCHQSRG